MKDLIRDGQALAIFRELQHSIAQVGDMPNSGNASLPKCISILIAFTFIPGTCFWKHSAFKMYEFGGHEDQDVTAKPCTTERWPLTSVENQDLDNHSSIWFHKPPSLIREAVIQS